MSDLLSKIRELRAGVWCRVVGHTAFNDCIVDNLVHSWREPHAGEDVGRMEKKIGVLTGRVLVRDRKCRRCGSLVNHLDEIEKALEEHHG